MTRPRMLIGLLFLLPQRPAAALVLGLSPRPVEEHRDWDADLEDFMKTAEARPAPARPSEAEGVVLCLAGLDQAKDDLKQISDDEGFERWGDSFFAQAHRLTTFQGMADLAGKVQVLEAQFRRLAAASANPEPPPAALSLLEAARQLQASPESAWDGGVKHVGSLGDLGLPLGAPLTRPKPALSNWVPPPTRMAPAGDEDPSSSPLGGSIGLIKQGTSLVSVLFKRSRAEAPVQLEYYLDGAGKIVGVSIPSRSYEETREFKDGLLARRVVTEGSRRTEYRYFYDAKGTLAKASLSNFDSEGYQGGAFVNFVRGTRWPIKGRTWNFDPKGRPSVAEFDEKGRAVSGPLADVLGSEHFTEFVADWQISREAGLDMVSDTRARDYTSPFWSARWPTVRRGFTSPEDPDSWSPHPITGVLQPHEGIDLGMPEGTQVYPARRGRVIAAGEMGGYGNAVLVQHYSDNSKDGEPDDITLYGHLSEIKVRKGQWVIPGRNVLGLVGSTGLSTGPHLHFEVRAPDGPVNPMEKLSPALPTPNGKITLATQILTASRGD